MFTDIIKVLIAFFFCIAIAVFAFILIYIAYEWCKYLFYIVFNKQIKKRNKRSKEQLINNFLDNL